METVSKSTLFGLAITIITAGVKLVESNLSNGNVELLYGGIGLTAVGVVLMAIFAMLLEKQVIAATEEKALARIYKKLNARLKELERKGTS